MSPRVHFLCAMLWLACPGMIWSQPGPGSPPTMYELVINGESFLVEANRAVPLESKRQPGVRYEVALRIAPTQRMRLGSVQFDYDWLAKVEDDRKPRQRTARLTHELGFTMLVTDLGRPLSTADQDEALRILTASLGDTFQKGGAKRLEVGQPEERKFAGTSGRGAVIRYRDQQDIAHTCAVYVLAGSSFSVSCLVQYLDDDLEDVKPLVQKTLDSFQPAR